VRSKDALDREAGFCVSTTHVNPAKASTPAAAGALVHPDPGAIRAMPSTRRGCRLGSTRRANVISARGCSRKFDDPIALPGGRALLTLMDAGNYIAKLPKAEHSADEWQAAMECLILVAEKGGPTMMARVGVMRGLNRRVERVFNPGRKDTHWGKRK
jgi:hypothetical protein